MDRTQKTSSRQRHCGSVHSKHWIWTFSTHVCLFVGGVFIGHIHDCGVSKQISYSLNLKNTPLQHSPNKLVVTRHLLNSIGEIENINKFSEHEYSCNSAGAFEELTSLHKKARNLVEHNKNGDANKYREATIARKATAAAAAELAFRECVGTMMPDLLHSWDESLKKGKLNFHAWNDVSEEAVGGITFKLLEETADSIAATIDS